MRLFRIGVYLISGCHGKIALSTGAEATKSSGDWESKIKVPAGCFHSDFFSWLTSALGLLCARLTSSCMHNTGQRVREKERGEGKKEREGRKREKRKGKGERRERRREHIN